MRDFVFALKSNLESKMTMRVDMVDDEFERFTIMWLDGVSNTIFEKYLPWKLGAVITEADIKAWLTKFQPIMLGRKYSDSETDVLGVPEHVLTITPTILNGASSSIVLSCQNSDGISFVKVIELETGVDAEIEIIEGYEYSISSLPIGDSWTSGSAPEAFTCDGDEAVALGITKTIDLDVHTATITPTLVNGLTTNVTMRGTKNGYETINTPIVLETGVDVTANMYEGYSYTFILNEGDTWTSGSAPDAVVCDGDEAIALGITTPIE